MKQTEKQTLGEKTAQNLLEMIQQKEYAPGDKLPTEAELVETLGVGRNTVREALRILMSRNIVTIRQGSGTLFPRKWSGRRSTWLFMMDDRRQLTEDLIQARLILEPALAALAAQNGSEEEIKDLERILEELEKLIRDKKDYSEKDSQFHAQIATCSHNRVMTNLIPVITEGVRVFADSVEETEYEQTLLSHRRILKHPGWTGRRCETGNVFPPDVQP